MNEWGLKFFDNKNKERRKNVKQVIPVESYPAVYTESSREALSETARGARLDQDAGRGISFPCHFGCMIRYGAGFWSPKASSPQTWWSGQVTTAAKILIRRGRVIDYSVSPNVSNARAAPACDWNVVTQLGTTFQPLSIHRSDTRVYRFT